MVTTPVPPILDVDRYASYAPAIATTDFALGFPLFGDASDIAVYVNGVEQALGADYTVLSVTTGATLTPIPITDAFARLSGPVSSGIVEIYGIRRPRRTVQATAAYSTRDFNVVISDLISMMRELWSQFYRSIKVPVGDAQILLPGASARQSTVMTFDSAGVFALTPVSSLNAGFTGCAAWQMRKALSAQGRLWAVQNALPADPTDPVAIEWQASAPVAPGSALYAAIQAALSYDSTQMAALMALAQTQVL